MKQNKIRDRLSNYISVPGVPGLVADVSVYDIYKSVKASGYPMSTDAKKGMENEESGVQRARRLANTPIGSGHDNFLCGFTVAFDLTFTNKAWVEFERYHFANIVSSQSTMHMIEKFDISDQCCEYVDSRVLSAVNEVASEYKNTKNPTPEDRLRLLYSIPSGFKLTARVVTNYRQLKTIYAQRRSHRLPEWRMFCKWIETLPYSELITGIFPEEESQKS